VDDFENYTSYKSGTARFLKLKDGVIPHLFECQGRKSGNKRLLVDEDDEEGILL